MRDDRGVAWRGSIDAVNSSLASPPSPFSTALLGDEPDARVEERDRADEGLLITLFGIADVGVLHARPLRLPSRPSPPLRCSLLPPLLTPW